MEDEDALVAYHLKHVADVCLHRLLRWDVQCLSHLWVHQLGVEPPRDDCEVLLIVCARATVEQLLTLVFVEYIAADV